jgi:hypothetical protein
MKGTNMDQKERNKKIIAAIKAETTRATASKSTARAALINEGIYTVKGKLKAEFGGTVNKKKPVAA